MAGRLDLHDGTDAIATVPALGTLIAHGGAPTASDPGYAVGCLWIDKTNAVLYINTGTLASATWTVVGTQS